MEEFGLIPEFKAGIHGGDITVAEVGDIKREIAYHGDVINTAARIQGKCNDFQREILVSRIIHDHLHDHSWQTEKMGEVQLKGKQEPVTVYAILNNIKKKFELLHSSHNIHLCFLVNLG